MGVAVQAVASEMGTQLQDAIELNSDASPAIGITSLVGSGKVRHIDVTQLWLQDKVSRKEVVPQKVGTDDNLANALSKGVDASCIGKHFTGVGLELKSDRLKMASSLEIGTSAELALESE